MRSILIRPMLAAALAAVPVATGASTLTVDPNLPPYQRVSGISGNLNSIGSDTLNNLMTLWAEGFRNQYPNVRIQIEGKGSSTAPPALIEGTAQLGPMSRPMKAEEIHAFEAKRGFAPSSIPVALDSLAVYVHKDNPLESTSIPAIDAAFSKSRRCGAPAPIETWAGFGVEGPLAKMPLSLYGRNSASGTYGYFKEHALCKGDYRDTVKEQPGSASVVNSVANDRAGIGYSGIGYKTSGVKALALAKEPGGQAYAPTYENVLSGDYPLGRQLLIYFAAQPGQPLDPLVREFLLYVLSKEGQEVVVKDGYLPLPESFAAELRKQLK